MSRDLTTTTRQAFYSQETGEAFLILLTFEESSLPEPIRVVNNPTDIVSGGDIYQAFPFEITLPDEGEDRAPTARLRIDNVDRSIVQAVRNAVDPIIVTMEIIRADDPDTIEVSFPDFELREVTYDALIVEGRLLLKSLRRRQYPADTFSPSGFPGLF